MMIFNLPKNRDGGIEGGIERGIDFDQNQYPPSASSPKHWLAPLIPPFRKFVTVRNLLVGNEVIF